MYYIIGKNNCIWCDRAKSFLDKKKVPYVYKNLDEITKMEIDRFEISFQPFDIAELASEVIDSLEIPATNKNIL